METKISVLFLCTGNSARSQMAEGLLRHLGGDRYEALSAGLDPKGVNPLAVEVMDEVGIDIRNQTSKSVKEYLRKKSIKVAVFVCASAEQNCPAIFPFAVQRLSWPLDDPAAHAGGIEKKRAKFREIRDSLEQRIRKWLSAQEKTQ